MIWVVSRTLDGGRRDFCGDGARPPSRDAPHRGSLLRAPAWPRRPIVSRCGPRFHCPVNLAPETRTAAFAQTLGLPSTLVSFVTNPRTQPHTHLHLTTLPLVRSSPSTNICVSVLCGPGIARLHALEVRRILRHTATLRSACQPFPLC